LLLFICRATPRSVAQKLLLGSSLGFMLLLINLIYLYTVRNVLVPIPVLIVFSFLSFFSLYVSTRKYQD